VVARNGTYTSDGIAGLLGRIDASPNHESLSRAAIIQGWFEAMTSLGRVIFFVQPGTDVSDPQYRPWSYGPKASPRCSTISEAAKRFS
jgi:hypothetical protein